MKILVAGGTGFIGTPLCTELHERGHEVTALSRDPSDADLPAGVDRVAGDVSAYDSIAETVAGHDAVVNLVSLSPLYQPPDEDAHERIHLGGTANLVRAAEDGGVDRFLQMSALGADPDADTEFLRTKGEAEDVVTESRLAWTIVRPSVVFGDGAEFLEFTKQLTTPYVTGLPGGGKTRFQPIWVGDLVPMLADVLADSEARRASDASGQGPRAADSHVGETYEIAGPQIVTLADATELAYAAEGKSVSIVSIPMSLAKFGLSAIDPVPFLPFGADQARSLEINNTVVTNDVSAFGVSEDELTTLGSYLGVGADGRREASRPSP
ncbi:complex I NDUFA9 subunit family protein [Haloterrigena sp. SYSU A558-1]|uniref:Complex I NDUFA9 subunit family protein n=1 Tax=Haloterrigena gelatinilytica TaxID=2741724 RepID=A0A8J8GJL4_9EURY|nr:complex I NDUFA9 subunit family protein [Haloterrigena gelatinilytica]NUB90766.1 complex I NDUFA9 subunit family protein [Haloterrigena gelatinilytica]NUC73417.1 complex I NDUFA9 subunit family protein [Haloterrigena gelatinilytica]